MILQTPGIIFRTKNKDLPVHPFAWFYPIKDDLI
jgi:hypothetical protein